MLQTRLRRNNAEIRASCSSPDLRERNGTDMRARGFPRQNGNFPNGDTDNPADMLPREDFNEINERIYIDCGEIVWCIFRICAIIVVVVNVICLVLDPTPIVKVYDYFVEVQEDFDYAGKIEEKSKDIKMLQAKIGFLNEQVAELKRNFRDVQNWRENLQKEVAEMYNKTKTETAEHLRNLEVKIEEAISLYDADKLGIIDYALESAGGSIISTPSTLPYPTKASYDLMGVVSLHSTSSPSLMIQPGTLPGQCFAFHGQIGRIRIKLSQKVHITSVSMEHASPKLVQQTTSSPKDFKLYGLENGDVEDVKELGVFTYKADDKALQTFELNNEESYEFIELNILSNYGHPEYTCVYRFRVHGILK